MNQPRKGGGKAALSPHHVRFCHLRWGFHPMKGEKFGAKKGNSYLCKKSKNYETETDSTMLVSHVLVSHDGTGPQHDGHNHATA